MYDERCGMYYLRDVVCGRISIFQNKQQSRHRQSRKEQLENTFRNREVDFSYIYLK